MFGFKKNNNNVDNTVKKVNKNLANASKMNTEMTVLTARFVDSTNQMLKEVKR